MSEQQIFSRPDFSQPPGSYEPPRRRLFDALLRSDKPILNYVLFVLTCISTTFVGYQGFGSWTAGLQYSTTIVAILLSHEMGHYLMCRRYGIRATLPFFIPFPLMPFGTMGAVIRMEARLPDRRVLFDVGAAGPLAGLVITIPAIFFGLQLSTTAAVSQISGQAMTLGDSLLFQGLSWLAIGNVPNGYDTLLHPIAFAGWAGLFVTALNLLPIGQLDGGHITYALIGRSSEVVFRIALALFALICIKYYHGWILLILLLIWFGYRHPPTLDPNLALDAKRKGIAYLTFVIFILSFTPVPFKF
jgi:membrane-associated protease RseP (regulator of RpoE activity)